MPSSENPSPLASCAGPLLSFADLRISLPRSVVGQASRLPLYFADLSIGLPQNRIRANY